LIRQILIAISFLTRLPAGNIECTAMDVGRAARWFPLVGALLGAIYIVAMKLLSAFLPALLTAVLIVAIDALLTGVMHLDGLADTADGFVAGRTRDDVLRIMRDHAIGSYGASALILAIALKIAAIDAFAANATAALLLAPVLGRWSAVFSSAIAGYARPPADDSGKSVGAPARFVGRTELIFATSTAAVATLAFRSWRGAIALLITAAIATAWTMLCRNRIGGVTGDTLGAGIVIVECLVLIVFAAA
jgi:adenosylcobinamide-GDP ribazoletransferase